MNAAEVFASHALRLTWRDIPAPARQAARIFLFDTLAVGVAGVNAPFATEAMRWATRDCHGDAVILGRPERSTQPAAAMVNAYQIHAQEFDCVHEAAVLHPFSAVLGAMIAVGSSLPGISGQEFGAALVAGVDIAVGLGLAGRDAMKFFRPATCGIFGATAAVARLRGLNQAQAVASFGHALAFAAGTMQAHVEGTPGLALQVGAASRNAVLAVDLAQEGVPGALGSIDGPWGYLEMFENAHDIAPVLASLGRDFAVSALSHKPYPTGRAAHGGIWAVRRLMRDHGVRAGDITALRYVAPSLIHRLVGRPAVSGMGVNYARLCLPFLAAHTAWHGTVRLDAFSPAALADRNVLALAANITVSIDDNPDPAAFVPCYLHASVAGGRQIDIPVSAMPGSIAAPLDEAARLEKAQACLAFGGSSVLAEILAGCAEALDGLPDIHALLGLVTGAGGNTNGGDAA